MQTSVTLAQLPYTGFDYGDAYNSLFWVALLIWSIVVATIIHYNKGSIGSVFNNLAKVFMVDKKRVKQQPQQAEPVLLSERVVRFDPLVDPIAAKSIRAEALQESVVVRQQPLEPSKPQGMSVVDKVHHFVEKELAVTRIGQTPDEFSSGDFSTVDFDGVNPDDSWQPRAQQAQKSLVQTPSKPQPAPQQSTAEPIIETVESVTPPPPLIQKVYTDTISLNIESEYPKIVLSREEVA